MEIKKRIAVAKKAFESMRPLMTNNHILIRCRIRLIRTYVWSVLLYDCEAWTINVKKERRLEAMEMWYWRRVLKIPWTAHVTNEEVLRRIGTSRELLRNVRGRHVEFLGHIMRRESLENISLTGRMDG